MAWRRAAAAVVRQRRLPGAAAALGLASAGVSACAAQCEPPAGDPWKAGPRVRDPWRRGPESLEEYGTGPIPEKSYKDHFANAYNTAATERDGHATNGTVARRTGGEVEPEPEKQLRRAIARHLMAKLGYSENELDLLGDDVLRMQGVNSPFQHAALRGGETVLDLGSGYGTDACLAAAKVGGAGRVIGLDISKEEVRKATERATERGLSQCQFVVGDMEQQPFDDASFDVVISNGGFCLCPDKRRAFAEIFRVLRPGGRIAIACTINRAALPSLAAAGKRWPPCMEVFMQRSVIEPTLEGLGFVSVGVDMTNDKMDVWEVDVDTVATDSSAATATAGGGGGEGSAAPRRSRAGGGAPFEGCSHAKKAAERRKKEEVATFLSKQRESGIHWGNPEFDFTKEVDMNELCARVVIYAEKPAAGQP